MADYSSQVKRFGWQSAGQLLLLTLACAAPDDRVVQLREVTDSAGVEIVTNGTPPTAWQLADTASLVIGSVDGSPEELFTRIISVLRMPDGRIVAANFNHPPQIRFFSAAGDHLVSAGRAGEGPGEFSSIGWVERISGDSLLAYDPWTSRFTVFSSDGVGGGITVLPDIGGLTSGRIALRDMFGDGSLLGVPNLQISPGTRGSGRTPTPIMRASRDLSRIDTLVVVPGLEYSTPGDQGAEPVTFGATAVVHAAKDRLIVGDGADFEFRAYDLTGAHIRSVRWQQSRRRATDADVEALVDRQTADAPDPDARRRAEAMYRRRDVADEMPRYSQILTDMSDHVWVREFALDGEDGVWRVFSPAGFLVARVVTPARLRVHEIGSDYVLGVWRDDLGVESVRMYALER